MDKNKVIDDKKRYERQSDIFCGKDLTVAIVGVGAVGRQVALQLCAMGVSRLVLIDFDTVEEENLSAQGFRERDLGKAKVEAVRRAAIELNSTTRFTVYEDIYAYEKVEDCTHVCCCVDNMTTRKAIVEDCDQQYIYDSRMAALVCSIKTISSEASYDHYMEHLFGDDEMVQETCTAKTTLFCANICAGLMVNQLVRAHTKKHLYHDITLDLKGMAYFCNTGGDEYGAEMLTLNGNPPKVVRIT
jgi:sulfur carrier protein ThiS adenylyltransferase